MDKIRIENLEIFAKHGVFPEENFLGQKFTLRRFAYRHQKSRAHR